MSAWMFPLARASLRAGRLGAGGARIPKNRQAA